MAHRSASAAAPRFRVNRTLLWLAALLACAAAGAVLLVADSDNDGTSSSIAVPAQPNSSPGVRYDGGPEEGTALSTRSDTAPSGVRYDGGPEEGTALSTRSDIAPSGVRYDGGPEEGAVLNTRSDTAPSGVRYDGGPEEGAALKSSSQSELNTRPDGAVVKHGQSEASTPRDPRSPGPRP